MKILSPSETTPAKFTLAQACLQVGSPLVAFSLIAIGVWMLPLWVMGLFYFGFLILGFSIVGANHLRKLKQAAKADAAPYPDFPRREQDDFPLHTAPDELHLEMLSRALKNRHALHAYRN